ERHGGHGAAHGRAAYWEQEYNLAGARAFLVVIASLAVFSLIIPNYTKTEPDPSQAPMKAVLFASITVLFYVVFVIIQTVRHRAFFAEPSHSDRKKGEHDASAWRQWAELACPSRPDAPPHPPSHRAPPPLPPH